MASRGERLLIETAQIRRAPTPPSAPQRPHLRALPQLLPALRPKVGLVEVLHQAPDHARLAGLDVAAVDRALLAADLWGGWVGGWVGWVGVGWVLGGCVLVWVRWVGGSKWGCVVRSLSSTQPGGVGPRDQRSSPLSTT